MKKSIVMRLINSYVEKNIPFIIVLHGGNQSNPLRFLEDDSECLIVESISDGVLAAYDYEDIANLLPFTTIPSSQSEFLPVNTSSEAKDFESGSSAYWHKEYEKGIQFITCKGFSLIDRRDDVKARVKHTEIAKDWGRIDSMFNDAKKNHSLEQKADRIISELDSLPQCTEVKISLGMVFAELKEFDTAAEEFYNGGDYHNAAYCAMQNNDEKTALYYLKCLIKSDDSYDNSVLTTLFFLINKYNDIDFCVANFYAPDISRAEIVFYGLLMLYKSIDDNFSRLESSTTEYLSNISIIISKLKNHVSNENDRDISFTSYTSISNSDVKLIEQDFDRIFGEICSFNKYDNNGFGFISTKENETIYYNIRQIEDERLRNIIWNDNITSVRVSFTLGVGINGKKAADHIKIAEDFPYEEFSEKNTVYDGMIDSYGNYDIYGNRYGVIIYNNKQILFRDEAIIDPILKKYFKDSFSIKNIYVKFVIKKVKNNWVALKVWLDIDEEKKLFDELYEYIPKKEYDNFIEKKNEIEHGTYAYCPYKYSSLPIWNDKSEDKRPNNYQLCEVPKSVKDVSISHLGTTELLEKGTQYLVVIKDLKKAEFCFLTVLERNPERSQINTAVSNLIAIYLQENQTDAALNILLKYRDKIEKDKYNNQLIQIYDKSKRYSDLIDLLNDVIPNTGKSKSHRIKQLITCYLKTNNASAAMQALKKYRSSIDEMSYNNLYSSALEILGDYSELESFLKKIVESTYRVEYKLNYMNKLALFYQKNENTTEAISIYEQWKKYYISNRSNITTSTLIATVAKLEITVDRNLCILYYGANRVEDAKSIARNLLRKNSEDSIAQQILDDVYIPLDNEQPTISDSTDEYVDFEGMDDSIPKLLEWMMNNIDYDRCLYNRNILKNIKDTRYVANESQAKTDISEVLSYFENRSYAEKSMVYLALAKIIKQIVDNGRNDEYFTQKKVNWYFGKSLLLKADADIQSGYQTRDCSRYYYFLSLRYLSRTEDTESFFHAINMLYYSFFLSDNELAETITKEDFENKLCVAPPEYQDSVVSVKELMICTFDLYINYHRSKIGDMKIIRTIINSIFENTKLRTSFSDSMKLLVDFSDNCQNADDYFGIWIKAKNRYNKIWNNLQGCISGAANNVTEPEKLNCYLNDIMLLNAEHILGRTDVDYLNSFIAIIKRFQKINELVIIDDLLDALDNAVDLCETLEKSIHQSPTNLSYESLLDIVIMLKSKAIKQKNDLYSESRPNLVVYPEDTAFYKGEHNQAKITLYVENRGNVQKADISNITLTGKNNNIEIIGNPEHTITTVHGNGKDEYTVDISFSESEKERKVFDITFSFEYSYFDGNGEQVKSKFSDIFQINLSSMETFAKIKNKYSAFVDGGAVESEDMFFGREKEINNIVDSLDQGDGNVLSHRGIYMYGQKRAGKSSIMAHLASRINDRYPDKYIIIDLGSIGTATESKYDIWLKTNIISRLEDELYDSYPDIYDEIESTLSFDDIIKRIEAQPDTNDFDRILYKIEKMIPEKVIMLFVDEFTYIYEGIQKKQCSDTFPHFWKALLQNHRICSIIIGQDSMINFAEDYANDFACMQKMFVSYLEEDGAKELITDPIKDNEQNRFEEEAVDLIYQLTAGSAYLIMIICSQLVEYMNERGTSRVTKTTIETFIKKWLMNTAVNSNSIDDAIFDPQLNDPCFFEDPYQVSRDNKIILTFIAKNCNYNNQIKINEIDCVDYLSQKTVDYQNQLINQLIKRKVLIKDGEYCRIWVDLLRRYLRTVG